MAALPEEMQMRIKIALGYGLVNHGAFFEADGMTAVVDYSNRLQYMMNNVNTGAEPYILSILQEVEKIEEAIANGAICRLKLSSTNDVEMNPNELSQLERQYMRWVMKLCDVLSCYPYPRSNLFRMMKSVAGLSGTRRF